MAVDQITPVRAAALSNTTTEQIGVPAIIAVVARIQSNLASFTPISATQDGVNLFQFPGQYPKQVVLTAQSAQAENGIYVAGYVGGLSVTATGTFDGSGNYVKSGLTPGRLYYVRIIHPGETCTNGTDTLTGDGCIAASGGGTLTFQNGAASATNTNLLYEAKLVRDPLFDAPNEFPSQMRVRVQFGTDANTWWNLRQAVPTLGSSPVIFDKILPSSHTDAGPYDDAMTNADP